MQSGQKKPWQSGMHGCVGYYAVKYIVLLQAFN